MKNKYMLIFILVFIQLAFISCPIGVEEPDWSDFDGDGVTGYDDVDDIIIPWPDTNIVTTLTPVLTIRPMNPYIVSRYWIQIFPYYTNYEEFLLFSKDDYGTNECLIPPNILHDGRYIWRAKAYDSINNRWSNSWSDVLDFVVQTGIPYIIPANGESIVDSTPLLDWSDFPEAAGYHLQVGSYFDSSSEILIVDSLLDDSYYQLEDITSQSYSQHWRVKHLNTAGVWSEWSSTYYFRVSVSQPSIPNPDDGSFVRSPLPLLDWEDVPGVVAYRISVSGEDGSYSFYNGSFPDSEIFLEDRLTYGETYSWKIFSQNEDGEWGDNFMTPTIWQFGFEPINFTEHIITDNYNAPSTAYAADIDSDGDLDLLGAEYLGSELSWWENDGSGNFTGHTIDNSFPGGNTVFSIDIDNDSDIDIIGGANGEAFSSATLAWWENDSNENFTKHEVTSTLGELDTIFASDLNGDGFIDILGGSEIDGDIYWWENDGNESFIEHSLSLEIFWDVSDLYATDMDGDNDIDIFGAVNTPADIVWWENNGDETFTEHIIDNDFDDAKDIYVLDMDNDGDIDVIGATDTGDKIAWWENNGSESFTKHLILENVEASSLHVADLNMDNELDIIVTLSDTHDVIWFENDGAENFTQRTLDSNYHTMDSVYAGDFDGDGDIDVFGPVWVSSSDIWWENNLFQ